MAQASGRGRRRYDSPRSLAKLLLLASSSPSLDAEFARVTFALPNLGRIARACDRAALSLGIVYGGGELFVLARLQQPQADRAIAFYNAVADLGRTR